MGQKTHPKGFRLITTQNHLSSWYKDKFFYKHSLEEDRKLRLKIEQQVKTFLIISQIEIKKGTFSKNKQEKIEVIIHALFPTEPEAFKLLSNSLEALPASEHLTNGLLAKQIAHLDTSLNVNEDENFSIRAGARKMLFFVLREIAKQFQKDTGKTLKIQIQLIENLFDDAHFVAQFIGEQLEQRVPFRRVLNQTLTTIEEITDKGVKIQISGRLNGNDIAKSEWDLKRSVPLHTLNAKIDYAHHIVRTASGILGVKVWLSTPMNLL